MAVFGAASHPSTLEKMRDIEQKPAGCPFVRCPRLGFHRAEFRTLVGRGEGAASGGPELSPMRRAAVATRNLLLAVVAGMPLALAAPASAQDVALQRIVSPKKQLMYAEVDVYRGEFFRTSPTFVSDRLGYEMTYRARTGYRGLFGQGWGSSLETRLVPMPNGTVVVIQDGNDQMLWFGSPDASQVNAGLETMADAHLGSNSRGTPERAQLIEKLSMLDYQVALVEAYKLPGVYPRQQDLPLGSGYNATFCPKSTLFRSDSSFRLDACDFADTFDEDGALSESTASNIARSGFALIHRDKGRIKDIAGEGGSLTFTYAPSSVKVTNSLGIWWLYTFNKLGQLVRMESSDGKSLVKYRYDERENLVEILASVWDGMQVAYDEFNRVTSIKYADGRVSTFDYRVNAAGNRETEVDGYVNQDHFHVIYEFSDG